MTIPSKFRLSIAGTVLALLVSCSDESPRFPTEAEVELMYSNYSSSEGISSSSETSSSSSFGLSSSSEQSSSSSVVASSSSEASCGGKTYNPENMPLNTKCNDGILSFTFTDNRDDYKKEYKAVVIGTQIWMAENLYRYVNESKSKCYDDGEEGGQLTNCLKYGHLYDWETAMSVSDGHKDICPSGWHLPTDAEWTTLINFARNDATKLKSKGWNDKTGNGTDDFGFSALPGGSAMAKSSFFSMDESSLFSIDESSSSSMDESSSSSMDESSFDFIGSFGLWWSSSTNDYGAVYVLTISEGVLLESYNPESFFFSVRCIRDN